MRDFTLHAYKMLCLELKTQGYEPITFVDYCIGCRPEKHAILRHDVDKDPRSALQMALLENRLGIKASYYFRFTKTSHDKKMIERIAEMDHEIGYHYEDLSVANGNVQHAIKLFEMNLSLFRELYPVKTVCMHGSPLSKWDNRLLWRHYDYRDFGIVGEPYFDVDFDNVLYLTDTGRSWKGKETSIRDKVHGSDHDYVFRRTTDIVGILREHGLPNELMLNIHPQRWHDKYLPWLWELLWQKTKNIGKRFLVRMR